MSRQSAEAYLTDLFLELWQRSDIHYWNFFLVIGLAFDIDKILNNQTAEFIIGSAGGLFLLWMGWRMSKNPVGSAMPIVDKSGDESSRGPISAGIILSASNPYFLCGGPL